jgi:hypothetical protein
MRYLVGLLCVCALGVVPFVGCSESAGVCSGTVCPCTEEGILGAIAAGGGAYTFDCEGPTTVVTQAEIVIDNDVILDGEGNLTVDADHLQRVFSVPKGVNAELHRLTATHGRGDHLEGGGVANEGTLSIRDCVISHNSAPGLRWPPGEEVGGGIRNAGQMTIINSTISENFADHTIGGGIYNGGEMTIINSTVSDNGAGIDGSGSVGGGIYTGGEMTIINSTVSDNSAHGAVGELRGGGISNGGTLTLTHSTVWGNTADSGDAIAVYASSYTEIANTLIDGDCGSYDTLPLPGTPDITSNGYNIESPGNTCGFDQATDLVDVPDLNLGPLRDNSGPTETHALLPGSAAIDWIPETDCLDADGQPLMTDQRGELRPAGDGCDVGAFEVQP